MTGPDHATEPFIKHLARTGGIHTWVFLGPADSPRKPQFWAIGFLWILSFESRLFNELRGKLRQKIFSPLLPRREAPERGRGGRGEGGVDHGDSLTSILFFCNKLSLDGECGPVLE